MSGSRYTFIAKEGWLLLFVLGSCAVLSFNFISSTIAFILTTVFCFFLFLLRDPERIIPSSPLAIVSPVEGKITEIDDTDDPWMSKQGLNRRARRVRLKMSSLNVCSFRSPVEGKVMEQWSEKRKKGNGQRKFAFWVRTDEGDDVVTVFRLKSYASIFFRIYIQSGERLGQGQRCGFLYFGGTVDVFFSEISKLEVDLDQWITSGEGIIAHLIHESPASMINDNNPHGKDIVAGDAA